MLWLMHDIVYDYRTDQLAAGSNMQISLTITVIQFQYWMSYITRKKMP